MQLRRGILLNTPHLATASGELATFRTDMGAKLKKLTVGIETAQSGTGNPSPSNVRPITAMAGATVTRAGKNLLEISARYDTKTRNAPTRTYDNGILGISGTVSTKNVNFYRQGITGLVKRAETCVVSTHIISGTTANLIFRINEYDENGTVVARKNLPTSLSYTSGHTYEFMGFVPTEAVVGGSISFSGSFQLELGSFASTYEPYRGVTIPVAFGKNLFDQANATIYTRWVNNSDKWANSSESRSYAIPAMPGVQVTVSANNENITIFRVGYIKSAIPTSTGTQPQLYDVTRLTAPGSVTLTPSSDATYIIVQVNASFIAESKIQVEYGATATEYSPCNTIYGGTLDVLTGVLTALAEKAQLLSSWTWYRTLINGEYFFNTSNLKTALTTYKNLSACDTFKLVGNPSTMPNPAPADMTIINAYSRYSPLNIRYDAITSVEDFKTFLANNEVNVVLQRSTPQIIQLSPTEVRTLVGANNIWADTGAVETEYWTHI